MTETTRPKKLQPGARIGVVSPSYWLESERWDRAAKTFASRGYELVPGDMSQQQDYRFAGAPEQRAAEIMGMFSDPSIDAIICARGGYGANRVAPLLDYDLIRSHPKIFMGFSDITGLLTSLSQRTGLVTFHGPMLSTFGEDALGYNLDTLEAVLSGKADVRIASAPACRARVLRPGKATGALWGGNLSLVNERLGTRDQIDTRGRILLLEEVGEKIHVIDRMLQHLKSCGCLDGIAGLIIGELLEINEGDTPFGKSTDEIVLETCAGTDFPIISNFPCGHGDCQATLPVGHEIELDARSDDPFLCLPTSPVK